MERGVKRNRMHLEGGLDGRCHSTTRRLWLLENDHLVARSGTLVKKMNGIPTSDCVIRHMLSSFLAEASSFSVFLTSSSSWETRIL